jgi:hypothetical protein
MKTKRTTRTTEITVERDEVHVIRRVGRRKIMWCTECARDVEVMTPEDAMVFAGLSGRTVAMWIKTARVHFTETPEGRILICAHSALANQGDLP